MGGNLIMKNASFSILMLLMAGSIVRPQTAETPNFRTVVEKRLKTDHKIELNKICPIDSDPVADRVFRDYGAIFISNNGAQPPAKCIFDSENEVEAFQRFQKYLLQQSVSDQLILQGKLDELDGLSLRLEKVIEAIQVLYDQWPAAQRLDAIKGISVVSSVSIVARIGSIHRFASAEHLIGYAGLNPGVRQSDATRHDGHLGGGGTDKHLRHYLIEASVWARHLPRYHKTYERVAKRRGKRIGRLQVCRMMLRSIYQMVRDNTDFDPLPLQPQKA